MNIQSQKLELVQMLLDTNSSETLQKVKETLKAYSLPKKPQDDTEYLLSSEANRKQLKKSIAQLDKGKKTIVKTADLWK
jgi:oligoribonuclease NrnB/cAMP/cGMP phosphodiesterase (DHH superfamily)